MGKNASGVILLRASASSRRLSTATATATVAATGIKGKDDSLYRRLAALGSSDAKVAETLNEWVSEGKAAKRVEIIGCVNQLRKYKKYKPAVQLLEWMEKRGRKLTHGDHAIRVDLLSKAEGIASAEQYFNSLRESAKNKQTYGALLNSYCKEKMSDKAMALFERMEKLNLTSTTLAYNNLMSLRIRLGEPEKVPLLAQEMKEKHIAWDIFTYSLLMNSYASLNDIEGVERVVDEMNTDGVKFDSATYANVASIYVKAGLFDKANSAIAELDKMDNLRDREAFHILIGLYALTSNLFGVNRVWQSLKSTFPKITNSSYLVMLRALSKLGDMDALRKCFEEWELACSTYDIRVTNILIDSYLNRDMIKEAELLSESALKRGAKPSCRTLEMFMTFYLKKRQFNLALKYVETAASQVKAEGNRWQLSEETVSAFLKTFEDEKDVDSAENFCNSLKKVNHLNAKVYETLLRTYVAAGKTEPQMRQRMKDDGIEMSSEAKKLLERVCPK